MKKQEQQAEQKKHNSELLWHIRFSKIDNDKIASAWKFIWNVLFNWETKLFYDWISSYNPEQRFAHLPTPEEISIQYPNPCGWQTGMEDSMLNGGPAMCMVLARAELSSEPDMHPFATAIFDGMYNCATISDVSGFIARSISPLDKKSFYCNSSRDQYTLFVYAFWRYYHSNLATAEQKKKIESILEAIAERAEYGMRHGGELLRSDGKRGMVCKLWSEKLASHEHTRLPMLFLAAYDVSRNMHWLKQYEIYAATALERNRCLNEVAYAQNPYTDFCVYQMQVANALLHAADEDEIRKSEYASLLRTGCRIALQHATLLPTAATALDFDFSALPQPWRERELIDLCTDKPEGMLNGYKYLVAKTNQKFHDTLHVLNGIGLVTETALLSPELEDDHALILTEVLEQLTKHCDFTRCSNHGVIHLLTAYYQLWSHASKRKRLL